jgi:hypothetical protein
MLITVTDPWSVEDLQASFVVIVDYLDHAEQPVHTIIDLLRMHKLAQGALQAYDGPLYHHERSGYIVFVVTNKLAQTVAERAVFLTRFERAHMVNTYDEALAFLERLGE